MNYQELCYEMTVILDSMKTMLNIRQKDQESLTDYTKRFKTARDLMVSQNGGPPVLTRFVDSMQGVNKNIQKDYQRFQEIAFEQFMANTYLENSDQNKYGTLMNNLKQQQSLQNDQYPKTLIDATNVLSTHKFDYTNKKHQDKNRRREEYEEVPELSFAQLEGRCYSCGQIGHNLPKCLNMNKPKEEWHIDKVKKAEVQKAQSHVNATTASDDNVLVQLGITDRTSVSTTRVSHWTGTHSQFYQSENMKN
jgi:transposase-like protein